MSQTLPVNNFERIKNTSQFNKDFIKNYNEKGDKGHFFEVDVQYTEKLHELIMIYNFYLKESKLKKSKSL